MEYLSPGVFIEEVPARLKAIEGVSTSTAGFVGVAERGPAPGSALPISSAPAGIEVPRDQAPILVTSFADFVRRFGEPQPPSAPHPYLGHAVRAFFENGGKRCYVARVVGAGATHTNISANRGIVARLTQPAAESTAPAPIFLSSLRGVTVGAGALTLLRADGTSAALNVTGLDVAAGSATVDAIGEDLDPRTHRIAIAAATGTAPVFHARSPGGWGGALRVDISPVDQPATRVTAGATSGSDRLIAVASTSGFYPGAIVAATTGADQQVTTVTNVLSGNRLILADLSANVDTTSSVRVLELEVSITDEGGRSPVVETFRGLTWSRSTVEARQRHYANVINRRSRLLYADPGADTPDLAGHPRTATGFAQGPTGTGTSGTVGDGDFVGVNAGGLRSGLVSLEPIDEVRIVAIPGATSATIRDALLGHVERTRYRFAIVDADRDALSVETLLTDRNPLSGSRAAYYAPWLEGPVGDGMALLPPSGFVAGVMARTDVERGVHKAPANEVIRGAIELPVNLTTGEQDVLNPRGINVVRRFEGRGIRVWGARTLSADPEFRYVNVRRTLIFLEASIERGTGWVVFEPNEPQTWGRVTDSISAFLHTQWRNGLLFGRRPEDAFFVRCDESTMSADDIQNGRLICHIGVAIVRPAEFVIFRIEQISGFAGPS